MGEPLKAPEKVNLRAQAVHSEWCTALYGVPTMFVAELHHPAFPRFDLSSLRTGIMAGSPCPVNVMRRVMADMHMGQVGCRYCSSLSGTSDSTCRKHASPGSASAFCLGAILRAG